MMIVENFLIAAVFIFGLTFLFITAVYYSIGSVYCELITAILQVRMGEKDSLAAFKMSSYAIVLKRYYDFLFFAFYCIFTYV